MNLIFAAMKENKLNVSECYQICTQFENDNKKGLNFENFMRQRLGLKLLKIKNKNKFNIHNEMKNKLKKKKKHLKKKENISLKNG